MARRTEYDKYECSVWDLKTSFKDPSIDFEETDQREARRMRAHVGNPINRGKRPELSSPEEGFFPLVMDLLDQASANRHLRGGGASLFALLCA